MREVRLIMYVRAVGCEVSEVKRSGEVAWWWRSRGRGGEAEKGRDPVVAWGL